MRNFLLLLIAVPVLAGKIVFEETPLPLKLRLIKVVEETYYLLTPKNAVTFKVEGPTFVRVYTRLIFNTEDDSGSYKLLLSVDNERERVYTKKTVVSQKAKIDGRRVGKWRSILIEVPPGTHEYTLALLESSAGDVAFKIKETAPPEWEEVIPAGEVTLLKAVENERIVNYYLLEKDKSLNFKLTGPTRLKIISRLHFKPGMPARAGYTLLVLVDGRETLRAPVNTYPSEVVFYKNKKDVIPSSAKKFYLDIEEGRHLVTVKILGTLAPGAGVRVLKLKKKQ